MLVVAVCLARSAERSSKVAKDSVETMKITATRTQESTEKHFKVQAKAEVLKEYSSVRMGEHISKLYVAFLDDEKSKEMIAAFDRAWKSEDFSEVHKAYKEVNDARRRVAWYFTKIHKLYVAGILRKSDVRELTDERAIEEILLAKVRPLDRPERREDETYLFFGDLYPVKDKVEKSKS